MTTWLRGKTCGQRGDLCGFSGLVNSDGVPPVEGTRIRLREGPTNTMLSSSPQLAPWMAFGASHSLIGAPPATEIFCSAPPAANPIHLPSGEKNGAMAP